jgi:hypothetical protein
MGRDMPESDYVVLFPPSGGSAVDEEGTPEEGVEEDILIYPPPPGSSSSPTSLSFKLPPLVYLDYRVAVWLLDRHPSAQV